MKKVWIIVGTNSQLSFLRGKYYGLFFLGFGRATKLLYCSAFRGEHPNIIKCYGWFVFRRAQEGEPSCVGVSSLCFGLVFERATSLDMQVISNMVEVNAKVNLFVKWLRDILKGLIYMHQHQHIHRDIKPGNIVNVNGTLKLIDFGYSNSLEHYTNTFAGSPGYAAPEVWVNAKSIYGQKADVYSFGKTALCLWNGVHSTNTHFAPGLPDDIHKLLEDSISEDVHSRPHLYQLLAKVDECCLLRELV